MLARRVVAPKTKRSRKRSDCRLRLNDECPRIGSGVRGVQITKRGRKWVHFRETSTGATGRLPVRDFERAAIYDKPKRGR